MRKAYLLVLITLVLSTQVLSAQEEPRFTKNSARPVTMRHRAAYRQ